MPKSKNRIQMYADGINRLREIFIVFLPCKSLHERNCTIKPVVKNTFQDVKYW
jgi:hypothetical protein